MPSFRPAKAFSLIELLLVAVLLSVLAGLAVPQFSKTYATFQLKETAANIAYLLRYAQGRSVVKNKKHQFQFSPDYLQYWLEEEQSSGENPAGSEVFFSLIPGRLGRISSVPEGVTITSDRFSIVFTPDGKIDKTKIEFQGKNGGVFTILTFAQTGYVQVLDFKIP